MVDKKATQIICLMYDYDLKEFYEDWSKVWTFLKDMGEMYVLAQGHCKQEN